jgi:hypothetical protein
MDTLQRAGALMLFWLLLGLEADTTTPQEPSFAILLIAGSFLVLFPWKNEPPKGG